MVESASTDSSSTVNPSRQHSRFWLFAPFALFAIVILGWMGGWIVIRQRTAEALDAWVAREAVQGRQWDCPGRSVGGFPFRIEVSCPQITMQRGDLKLSAMGVNSVTQVYQPRHTIFEIAGPVSVGDGRAAFDASWSDLRASVRTSDTGLQTASLAIGGPKIRVTGLAAAETGASARALTMHVRPDPARPAADGVFDLVASLSEGTIPLLDQLVGSAEPVDGELQLAASQIRDPGRLGPVEAIERWREAGGGLRIALLSLNKGPRRLQGTGELALDELHRPIGRLDASATGLGDLIASLTGERIGGGGGGLLGAVAGSLLGGVLGKPRAQPTPDRPQPGANPAALAPLPPVLLQNGKVFLGPFAIPGVRLSPLY